MSQSNDISVEVHSGDLAAQLRHEWMDFLGQTKEASPYCHPDWLDTICVGLGHSPIVIVARKGQEIKGILPLAHMRHWIFGDHLVSLPFVNSAGIVARDNVIAGSIIDRAVEVARQLRVRHLQLRHESEIGHANLSEALRTKVHMRLALPASKDELWKLIGSKTRNLVRKSESQNLTVVWGKHELLDDFYSVFSRNMRDLGTPAFSKALFAKILGHESTPAELCIIRKADVPIAGALLVHHKGITEVPSASCLREFNGTNANMLMYWNLLLCAVGRSQTQFDFGRSTVDSNTYRFKAQWGAKPSPAIWQYHVIQGSIGDTRPESSKYGRAIRTWSRLPVWLTRLIGPSIVRGIP